MFTISVKRIDGSEVKLRPGGSAERQLIDEIKLRAQQYGVGIFTSEKKTLAAIEKAVEGAFTALKSDIIP